MDERSHCDCIKTLGGLHGFGAWCKNHLRLLEDYEFQKAKADEVVRLHAELEKRVEQLTRERDEWAAKWHAMRKQYAELRYPGMTGVIRPVSAGEKHE
jgi:hypothetical protein